MPKELGLKNSKERKKKRTIKRLILVAARPWSNCLMVKTSFCKLDRGCFKFSASFPFCSICAVGTRLVSCRRSSSNCDDEHLHRVSQSGSNDYAPRDVRYRWKEPP